MTRQITVAVVALVCLLALSAAAFAQTELPPPGWKTCPHCLTPEQQKNEAKFNVPGFPYNKRDLSGVWNTRPPGIGDFEARGNIVQTTANIFAKQLCQTFNCAGGPPKTPPKVPTLTPYGQQLFEATKTAGNCVPTDNDYFNQTHIAPGNQIPVSAIK